MVKNLTVSELLKELDVSFSELKHAFERCEIPCRQLHEEISLKEQQTLSKFFQEIPSSAGVSASKPGQIKRRMLVQVQSARGRKEAINVEIRKKRSYPIPTPSQAKLESEGLSEKLEISSDAELEKQAQASPVEPLYVAATESTPPAVSAEKSSEPTLPSPKSQSTQTENASTEKRSVDPMQKEATEALPLHSVAREANSNPEREKRDSKPSQAAHSLASNTPQEGLGQNKAAGLAQEALGSDGKAAKELGKKSKKVRSPERSSKNSFRGSALDLAALDDADAEDEQPTLLIPSEHLRSKLNRNFSSHEKKSKRSFTSEPLVSFPGSRGGKKSTKQALQQKFMRPDAPISRIVRVHEGITVEELADKISLKSAVLIKELIKLGIMARLHDPVEADVIELLSESLGHQITVVSENLLEEALLQKGKEESAGQDLAPRAPIVTVMGHVDHGKTSLLDFIRKTRVASGEAGGITQHLGATRVNLPEGSIVFIDTPGHQAFTTMRARGAKCTDVVVLVVAADDGVMPQTEEAIQHARAANVPIIVAITKSDKPGANPSKIKEALLQHELVCEEWGGEVQVVEVSSMTGAGMENLLAAILLQAELLDLKAPISGDALGVVLESKMDKGKGPAANILLQKGSLKLGDMVVCGQCHGRVRQLIDEWGQELKEAGPSTPITLYGLTGLTMPGDLLLTIDNERQAKELTEHRRAQARNLRLRESHKGHSAKWQSLSLTGSEKSAELEPEEAEKVTLNVVLKADAHGTLEALKNTIADLNRKEVEIFLRGYGVGAITEGDVALAQASKGVLIAFNVRPDAAARKCIEQEQVKVLYYNVIYEVIESLKAEISGRLSPIKQQQLKGVAEVRAIFRSPKFGTVAGCLVIEGLVTRKQPVRLVRDSKVILEAELDSLRRSKEDVSEVRQGTECGIGIRNYSGFLVGDRIEVYETTEITRDIFADQAR